MATKGNNLVIAKCAAKRPCLDDPVGNESDIDEFLVDLLRSDREINLAAFPVAVDVEESFRKLTFFDDARETDAFAVRLVLTGIAGTAGHRKQQQENPYLQIHWGGASLACEFISVFELVAELTTYGLSYGPAYQCQPDPSAKQETAGYLVVQLADLLKPPAGRSGERDPQRIADGNGNQEDRSQYHELGPDMHRLAEKLRQKSGVEKQCFRIDYRQPQAAHTASHERDLTRLRRILTPLCHSAEGTARPAPSPGRPARARSTRAYLTAPMRSSGQTRMSTRPRR